MRFPRASGILLHPTSLPSRYGIGDLGQAAYRFVDFLADTKQQVWQILPLGPTGHGNSPYMCYSAMAGNPMLISLDILSEQGLLETSDLAQVPDFPTERVQYDQVIPYKLELLKKAAQKFQAGESEDFKQFCQDQAFWLEDYSLFMALKDANGGASWSNWASEIARRQPETLEAWRSKLADDIFLQKFLQFEFCRQWFALKAYANERHIQIVGDMPIYVAHDSADVWAFPENFMIDSETLLPSQMAGVPPDYFSETGQLWGNPTYNWDILKDTKFDWWLKRIKTSLAYVDHIRIDHFRGFESFWAVPEGEQTAMNGQWIQAPGVALFEQVEAVLGKLPFLAEDLGIITPEVEALRDRFDFPGMKILQFAFGSDHRNPYLPFNCDRNFVIYTGTHDNDTTVGWYSSANDYEKHRLSGYFGGLGPESVHWAMIRLALSSIANLAIVPLQDLLGLGTEARMNTPGRADGNWEWRFDASLLTPTVRHQFTTLTELYGRATHQWS
ncbi:MAG: 4-alpha-glucanotransferase [Leptolyngbya sp. SIO3F4]|nr:4-alpha-glucanotransferase [Leptolyngbya sp. SIO3F4]